LCTLCLRNGNEGKYTQTYTTLAQATQALSGLEQLKSVMFCGTSGDPLGNPVLADIVEHVRQQFPKCQIEVHTNGGLGSAETFARLAQAGVLLQLGVDGVGPDNSLYRSNVRWDTVDRNAQAFVTARANGSIVRTNTLVFDQVKNTLPGLIAWAREVGIDGMMLSRVCAPAEPVPTYDRAGNIIHWLSTYDSPLQRRVLSKQVWYRDQFDQLLAVVDKFTVIDIPEKSKDVQAVFRYKNKPTTIPIKFEIDDTFIENKTRKINCHSLETSSIYINVNNYLLPCSMLGGSLFINSFKDGVDHRNGVPTPRDAEFVNKLHEIGLDKFNLTQHTITEVLDSGVLNKLALSRVNNTTKLAACGFYCGQEDHILAYPLS
jgi:hypothetical protein